MKTKIVTWCFAALILVFCTVCIYSQRSAGYDPNNPPPDWVRGVDRARDRADRMNNTRSDDETLEALQRFPPSARTARITAEERRRMNELRTPHPEDTAAYSEFLKQPGTGIVRLYPDADCVSGLVVKVSGECANFVDGQASLSFRRSGADIRYNNGELIADGFFSQSLIAELGDIQLDRLGLDSPGVAALNLFIPQNDLAGAKAQYAEIARGIDLQGTAASKGVEPRPNTSFAVRVIAYDIKASFRKRRVRGEDYRQLAKFDLNKKDKRVDLVAVFRVIRKDDDGSLTILWKELSRKAAPLIEFRDTDKLEDLK